MAKDREVKITFFKFDLFAWLRKRKRLKDRKKMEEKVQKFKERNKDA